MCKCHTQWLCRLIVYSQETYYILFNLIQELIEWVRYVAVVATLTFVLFFAVGPGSIPWMITAELFSQGPRPAAMSIAVLVNWLANFLVGLFFLPLKVNCKKKVFSPTNAFLFKFLPLTTLNRRRCTITFSYHSAYCWHFSGFSLTRSFLRRKTKLLTKSQHYFAAMIGKEFFNHFFSNKIFCHLSYVFRHFLFVPVCMIAFWHFCWFIQASLPVLGVFFFCGMCVFHSHTFFTYSVQFT